MPCEVLRRDPYLYEEENAHEEEFVDSRRCVAPPASHVAAAPGLESFALFFRTDFLDCPFKFTAVRVWHNLRWRVTYRNLR